MVSILEPGGILSKKLDNYESRPEQIRMSQAVEHALKSGGYLIIEAETGIGKTLAYLIPAILSGKRIVISTGTKNLQEQIYFKDIPLLKEILPVNFKAVYMKGRSNYLCQRRFTQFNTQLVLELNQDFSHHEEIKEWASITKTGDRMELKDLPDNDPLWNDICSKSDNCLGQRCETFDTCFITRLRQQSAKADIIIVNHHLFFADLSVKGTGYGEIIPKYDGVIFDEAHQLEDVATNYFGTIVSNYRFHELIRDILKELRSNKIEEKLISNTLNSLTQNQERFFNRFKNTKSRYRLKRDLLSEDTLAQAGDVLSNLELISVRMNNLKQKTEEMRNCSRRALEIKDELAFIVGMEDPVYVYWRETRGKGVFLHASPIDVSNELQTRLFNDQKTIVFTSATLAVNKKFKYFMDRLGLDEDVKNLPLSSHFDYQRQAILYLPKGIPFPNTSAFIKAISKEIEKILSHTSGRAFVLFTSYRNMVEVYNKLKDRLEFSVLLQGKKPKSRLLAEFKEDVNSVLFATHSFWEGVDVQGEALSCVIIDKLPFAPPSEPIVEARIENISNNGGNPFFDYQIPSAIITLKQGIGRLIRNRKDRGILSILDSRILSRQYGRIFINSLPGCPITNTLADIETFFKGTIE